MKQDLQILIWLVFTTLRIEPYKTKIFYFKSLFTTIILLLPSGIHLMLKPTMRNFRLALNNSSLIFFLFSFQVHEKSILIPAL